MRFGIVVENYRGDVRVTVWESHSSARGVQVANRSYRWSELGKARHWAERAALALSGRGSVEMVDSIGVAR